MPIEADTPTTPDDGRLLTLLAASRKAEQAHHDAASAEDEPGIATATECLNAILAEMAEVPATTWTGIAVKAARLCRSLYDSGHGCTVLAADAPVAESLAKDLARLAPGVRA